jgi:hypothetical protein
VPGLALARAISSFTDFMPLSRDTTNACGNKASGVTPARSRKAS